MINLKNNLFNENSIKKYSNNFILTSQKRVKLERYIERVQNNEFKGETKGYPAFLKFLEDILDYEEDKHISFDDNVDIGSDRVEFALKDNDGKFMVIELKGQNADLDKPQNRANDKRSPVEQAFGYAQHSSKKSGLVQWILVSNYKEFRLYNYDKRLGEYISFNVEDLLNEELFKYFMFAFSKESHVDSKAINDVVNEDYIEKTQLANNFYKLFNETRLMIFKELNELHGMDKNDAISNAQKILDRFIFICFASSRELLPENIARNILLKRIKSEDIRDHEIWRDLNYLFIDVDIGNDDRNISKYNGGLFNEDLEAIKLKDIIKDTNFFKDVYQKWNFKEFEEKLEKEIKPSILKRINPIYINLLIISYFDFSEENKEDNKHKLDIEILGHIFENSIGDLEELKEDSKGRRKKDGIFYTPDYITDYICKNTIIPYLSISGNVNTVEGLLKEYSTGHDVEKLDQKLKNIRIVDPACGSGAFLNKSTDILLEIHNSIFNIKKGYTTSQPMRVGKGTRRKTENVQHIDLGAYVFDALSKRREILLDNIYGVDLNSESVEITKLSLFLKVCEKDKILPAIDKNILCGNSLIDDPQFTDKPFNWKKEFKEIFNEGGFDIVVGNPPYVDNRGFDKNQLKYFYENYVSFSKAGTNEFKTRKFNTFVAFIEKIKQLSKEGGLSGYITHKNLLKTTSYKGIRYLMLTNFKIDKIVDWGPDQFADVIAETISVILEKNKVKDNEIIIEFFSKDKQIKTNSINQSLYLDSFDYIFNINLKPSEIELLKKMEYNKSKLSEFVTINNGIVTGNDKKFVISEKKDNYKICVTGKNIQKYGLLGFKGYLEYDPLKLLRARSKDIFEAKEKLIMQMINIKFVVYYDSDQLYNLGTTYAITKKEDNINLKYILAILNSKLMEFYYLKKFTNESTLTNAISTKNIYELPIVGNINQELFIEKANRMLQLKKDLRNELDNFKKWLYREPYNIGKFSKKLDKYYKLSFEEFLSELKKKKVNIKRRKTQELLENEFKESIKVINPLLQQIEETDSEIDQMVYDLYGLTNEEIKIVEDNI